MNRATHLITASLMTALLVTTAACRSERAATGEPNAQDQPIAQGHPVPQDLPNAQEQPNADGWVDLFDGESLDGWHAEGGAVWTVEDGVLIGKQGEDYAPGDLFTDGEYADFDLEVEYRVVWPANSGIWFRYTDDQHAYQADILEFEDPVAYSGSIYAPGKMFIAINEDPELEDREGWNAIRIRAVGEHLEVWLNGVQTAHVQDGDHASGRIGIQIHAGEEFGTMEIHIRKARIRVIE